MSKNDDSSRECVDERHRPKQVRSVETRNSILEAAACLFAEQGFEQTTTHQIASRAGVSVGALYRYFAGKEAIFKAIYRSEMSGLRNAILSEFSIADVLAKDVSELIRKALSLAFRVYSERPDLRRVLTEQSRKIPELSELRGAQESEVHQAVRQLLEVIPGIQIPDLEVGAYLISLFLESLIDDYILYRKEHVDFGDERVLNAAIDFILRYLRGHVES